MSWTQLEGDELLEPTVCKVRPAYPLKYILVLRSSTHQICTPHHTHTPLTPHIHTDTRTHTHTWTRTHTDTDTHTHTHTHHTHMDTHTRGHTHGHTHRHTHTHGHTHEHTHTLLFPLCRVTSYAPWPRQGLLSTKMTLSSMTGSRQTLDRRVRQRPLHKIVNDCDLYGLPTSVLCKIACTQADL